MNKNEAIEKIIELINNSNEIQYKYYAIPVTYTKRGHQRPITGLDRYETTEDQWLQNKDESKRLVNKAFFGTYKGDYIDYHRVMIKGNWREKLIKWLSDEDNF